MTRDITFLLFILIMSIFFLCSLLALNIIVFKTDDLPGPEKVCSEWEYNPIYFEDYDGEVKENAKCFGNSILYTSPIGFCVEGCFHFGEYDSNQVVFEYPEMIKCDLYKVLVKGKCKKWTVECGGINE